MSKKARPIIAAVLLVGVLGVTGLAFAATRKKTGGGTGKPITLPTSADPNLPTVQVGAATGYAKSVLIDTGSVNYDYIGPGWSYVGIRKDW